MAQFIALLFFLLLAAKAFLKEQQPDAFEQATEMVHHTEPPMHLLGSPVRIIQRLYF